MLYFLVFNQSYFAGTKIDSKKCTLCLFCFVSWKTKLQNLLEILKLYAS